MDMFFRTVEMLDLTDLNFNKTDVGSNFLIKMGTIRFLWVLDTLHGEKVFVFLMRTGHRHEGTAELTHQSALVSSVPSSSYMTCGPLVIPPLWMGPVTNVSKPWFMMIHGGPADHPLLCGKNGNNHQIWWLHLDLHHPHLHIPENLKQNDPSYLRVMGEQFWSLQGERPLRCSGAYDQDKTQKLHEGLMRSFCRSHRIISNPYSANHLLLEGTSSPKSYPMFFRR